MTPRQRQFCDEYLIDCNATQAAIRAGYSPKTAKSIGQRLLTFVDVKAYIDTELEKIQSEKIADVQEIMEYLTSVLRGEQYDEVLLFVGDGVQETTKLLTPTKDRIKAAELLGKRYGAWSDKTELTLNVPVVFTGEKELEE